METPRSALTARQKEILEYLSLGCTNREIARFLGVSVNTVKTHVAGLFRMLDVGNRTEAVHRFRQMDASSGDVGTSRGSLHVGRIEDPEILRGLAEAFEDALGGQLAGAGRQEGPCGDLRRSGPGHYRLELRLHPAGGDDGSQGLRLVTGGGVVLWGKSLILG